MADPKIRPAVNRSGGGGSPADADTSPAMGVHHHASLGPCESLFLALIVLLAAAAGWMLLERSTDRPPLKRYCGFELDMLADRASALRPHSTPPGNCASPMSSTAKTTAAPLTISPTTGVWRHTSVSASTGRWWETRRSRWCWNSRRPSGSRTRPIAAPVAPSSRWT